MDDLLTINCNCSPFSAILLYMKTKWQVEDGGESILYFFTGAIKPEWSFQKQEHYFQLLKKNQQFGRGGGGGVVF